MIKAKPRFFSFLFTKKNSYNKCITESMNSSIINAALYVLIRGTYK